MARGKANESNKAKKSSNTKSDTKGSSQNKKKSDSAADKNKSKAREKVAADQAKNSKSSEAENKKRLSNAAASKNRRIAKWEKPEKLELLTAWARDGLSMEQIAHNMGISKKTLYNWQLSSLPILHSLRKGKEESDSEVENTLFKKCNGFIKEVIKPMKIRKAEYDPDTGKKICDYDEIVYVKDQIYVQPDTAAIKYYLSNRLPDKWKDKVEQVIDTEADTAGVVLLAPVLEKNHEPTEESNMGTATQAN